MSLPAFPTPIIRHNAESWGPTTENVPVQFANVPYAPFGKGDRLGKVADFTPQAHRYQRRYDRRDGTGDTNAEFQYKYDAAEEESFELVDNQAVKTGKGGFRGRGNWRGRGRGRGAWGQQRRRREEREQQARGGGGRVVGVSTQNKRYTKLNRARWQSGRRNWRRRDDKAVRMASVKVSADWEVVEQFELSQLLKLQTKTPPVEDVFFAGNVANYDDQYDRMSLRTAKPLKRCEDKEFFYVTTTDDPVIQKLATQKAANVFCTDAILAQLMAAPRSVYPWDIVVQKVQDTLFFDKRDDSDFDYLSVSETATEPPTADEDKNPDDDINSPTNLSMEATMIQQNFSQQILKQDTIKEVDHPNPFFDEEDAEEGSSPATVGYKYRRWELGDEIMLLARCEVHGLAKKRGVEGYMTAYALNEWDCKKCDGIDWRAKIDSQRGAVLATELKNNSAKLAKWTAQSLVAGVDQIKIGFVSRVSRTNRYEHIVLGTQSYKPTDFAAQITLSVHNVWGIIKMFCELFLKRDDGKFLVMRDPNKPIVRIYKVPMNTFEEDDSEEEED
jgi:translation initiation factor 3 subunit D